MIQILCRSGNNIGWRNSNNVNNIAKLSRGGGSTIGWRTPNDTALYLIRNGNSVGWRQLSFNSLVTFNPSGGTVSQSTRIVSTGSALGALPIANWPGNDLSGWFTLPSGGSQINANTIINNDIEFFARWTSGGIAINVGGYNGGGSGSTGSAGGGGATDVRLGGDTLNHRIIIGAGGGGGSAGTDPASGGNAGSVGFASRWATGGGAGTASSGGSGGSPFYGAGPGQNGSLGQGGAGGVAGPGNGGGGGGGGGGGRFGGGGGGGDIITSPNGGGGGGGGSSFIDSSFSDIGSTATYHIGDGRCTIEGAGQVWTFTFRGLVETFIIPTTGTYRILCAGASGGRLGTGFGGSGAVMSGSRQFTAGQVLRIRVGGRGSDGT